MKKSDPHYDFQAAASGGGIQVVHCDDPYDLRPALDALQAEIESRTEGGRKLVVLMGEVHTMPTHIALRQSLIERLLSSSSPIACGLERSYNLLDYVVTDIFKYQMAHLPQGALSQADRDGQNLLKAYLASSTTEYAPVADRNFMKFCMDEEISVRANDAAKVEFLSDGERHAFLNHRDMATCRMIERYAPDCEEMAIPAISPEGMHVRNRMIVERALDHMRDSGAQIYIQACGNAHVYGENGKTAFYKSVSALFNAAGIDVLPIIVSSKIHHQDHIPVEAAALQQQGMIVTGLRERAFDYTDPSAINCNEFEEAALMDRINGYSGGEYKVMAPDCGGRGGLLWQEVASLIPSWVEETEDYLKKKSAPALKPS